ncbi:MAG: MFS transporter, partial [Bryocella sp.]
MATEALPSRSGAFPGVHAPDLDPGPLFAKVQRRVAPFLILLYFVAFLDRVNVSFASLTMNRDLHISDDLFGLAAGIFFVGYLIFAVPSNLMLHRVGARVWIAVLMVTWGLLSCSMAFVPGVRSYIVLRFLIGAAEAGFFPGIIVYLTLWLPGSARAAVMALFTFSIPLSNVIGAPLSSYILMLGGRGGLHSWQWLFLLEGLPAILIGLTVPFALAGSPRTVSWLTSAEKDNLLDLIAREEVEVAPTLAGSRRSLLREWLSPRLAIPSAIYFFLMIGLYALGFWVPRILSSLNVPDRRLGWLTAVPFFIGGVYMLFYSRRSDAARSRTPYLVGALASGSVGMGIVAFASDWRLALLGLSLAAAGILSAMPVFWAALSQRLTRSESVVVIAVVNSVGNIGGFLSPYAIGWLLKTTHRYEY